MSCCREITKMGVPPGNRPAVPRDWFPYLNGTSQGPTPEDARKDGHIRGRSRQLMKHPGSLKWEQKNPVPIRNQADKVDIHIYYSD